MSEIIIWAWATIMIFLAIQQIILLFEIGNLKDKIKDLEFKLEHKLLSLNRTESEE